MPPKGLNPARKKRKQQNSPPKQPQNANEKLFVRHIKRMAETGLPVVVAATPQRVALVDRLLSRFEDLPSDLKLCLLEPASRSKPVEFTSADPRWSSLQDTLALGADCGGVVVVSNQFREHMHAQGMFNPIKDLGVPVVSAFGYPPLIDRPPTPSVHKGITYQGMFELASKWAAAARFENPTYVEFGTLEGRTMTYAWQYMKQVPNLDFVAFDSFAGILGTVDDEEYVFPEGSFYANRETFMHNMEVCGVDIDRLTVTQCDITTLTTDLELTKDVDVGTPAVINIDVDVYKPALTALEYLTPSLAQGSLLLMDDYDSMRAARNIGERLALTDWLKGNPRFEVEEWRRYGQWGRAFIIHTEDGK